MFATMLHFSVWIQGLLKVIWKHQTSWKASSVQDKGRTGWDLIQVSNYLTVSSCLCCCPPKKVWICYLCLDDAKLVLHCWTRRQTLFISFSLCSELGAWLDPQFLGFDMNMLFFVTVVQEHLYSVVHEHVKFSSCNVMFKMCLLCPTNNSVDNIMNN